MRLRDRNGSRTPLEFLLSLLADNSSILFTCFGFIFTEIGKVRGNLFQINGNEKKPMVLPDAVGVAVNLSEKVYVPVKEFPDVSAIIHYC